MKKQIYDIVFEAQYQGLTTKEATDKLLLLFSVSGSLPKNTTIWKKAREMEFAYFRKWWFSRVGNDR